METKSRRDIKSEGSVLKGLRDDGVNKAEKIVHDKEVLADVSHTIKGGTSEGLAGVEAAAKRGAAATDAHFADVKQQLQDTAFDPLRETAADLNHKAQESYGDAKRLAGAVEEVTNRDVMKHLGEARDHSSEDALFLNDNRRERKKILEQGEGIMRELEQNLESLQASIGSMEGGQQPSESGKGGWKDIKAGWGAVLPLNKGQDHITRTNEKAKDGKGFHVTSESKPVKVRDYFDDEGNYKDSD